MGEVPLHEEDPLNVVDLSCLRGPVAGVGPNFFRSPLGIHRHEVDPVILHGVASPEAQPLGTTLACLIMLRAHQFGRTATQWNWVHNLPAALIPKTLGLTSHFGKS